MGRRRRERRRRRRQPLGQVRKEVCVLVTRWKCVEVGVLGGWVSLVFSYGALQYIEGARKPWCHGIQRKEGYEGTDGHRPCRSLDSHASLLSSHDPAASSHPSDGTQEMRGRDHRINMERGA